MINSLVTANSESHDAEQTPNLVLFALPKSPYFTACICMVSFHEIAGHATLALDNTNH